ncbi:uncharacterized protein ACA1_216570, partial [Acanthamoeba castellanii str. Neff]
MLSGAGRGHSHQPGSVQGHREAQQLDPVHHGNSTRDRFAAVLPLPPVPSHVFGAHVGGGFEFRVVEAVLTVLCDTLYERYGELKARIDHLLFGLEQATNGQDDYLPFLADLSHHNKTLNSFQKRVH